MIRIILLSIPCTIIFFGFFVMLVIEGILGKVLAFSLIILASLLLCFIETKTKKSLEKDTLLNDILNTDA